MGERVGEGERGRVGWGRRESADLSKQEVHNHVYIHKMTLQCVHPSIVGLIPIQTYNTCRGLPSGYLFNGA